MIADEATADVHARPLHIAIVEWAPGDELIAVLAQEIAQLGHDVTLLAPTATLPSRLDVLLLFGPFGPIAALTAQLAGAAAGSASAAGLVADRAAVAPGAAAWIARGTAELRAGLNGSRCTAILEPERRGAVASPAACASATMVTSLWLRRRASCRCWRCPRSGSARFSSAAAW